MNIYQQHLLSSVEMNTNKSESSHQQLAHLTALLKQIVKHCFQEWHIQVEILGKKRAFADLHQILVVKECTPVNIKFSEKCESGCLKDTELRVLQKFQLGRQNHSTWIYQKTFENQTIF